MDLRTTTGFLGTGASLASDLALLGYIFFLIPTMLVGFSFARRHLFVPHHKLTMTTITVINWLIILYLMLNSYRLAVAPKIPQGLNELFYLLPTIHLVTGGLAQILATILVIRMWFEPLLPRWARFEPIKPYMRTTLALWLVTALLGISIYLVWNVLPKATAPNQQPAVTTPTDATPDATENAGGDATPDATPEK
jgi:uncharacterized membrane protein YozB (DUF420 family)